MMVMFHDGKGAFSHDVLKMAGTVEDGEFHGQFLPYTQVLRSPRHRLSGFDEACCPALDCYFFCLSSGDGMEVDAPGKVEAPLPRCMDSRFELNNWHSISPASRPNADRSSAIIAIRRNIDFRCRTT